jgi:hypothetical protein
MMHTMPATGHSGSVLHVTAGGCGACVGAPGTGVAHLCTSVWACGCAAATATLWQHLGRGCCLLLFERCCLGTGSKSVALPLVHNPATAGLAVILPMACMRAQRGASTRPPNYCKFTRSSSTERWAACKYGCLCNQALLVLCQATVRHSQFSWAGTVQLVCVCAYHAAAAWLQQPIGWSFTFAELCVPTTKCCYTCLPNQFYNAYR